MSRYRAGMLVSLIMLAAAAMLAGRAWPALAATHGVTVTDDAFQDASSSGTTTTITAGDSVTWTWSGTHMHSVTADDASFDSDPPSGSRTSGSFTQTFSTPGTYGYYCRIHGAPGLVMFGTIVVQAAAPTSTATQASATDTPGASNTPVTRTATPTATETPPPSGTGTPAPLVTSAASGSATPASAGAAEAVSQLPRTGSAGSSHQASLWLAAAIALAAGGVACLVARSGHKRNP